MTDDKRKNSSDGGAAEVDEKIDQEQEQGYRGTTPDPTPNENYTVAGVVAGKPTPETDEDAGEEARKARQIGRVDRKASRKGKGR